VVCYGGGFGGSGCDVHAAGAEVCGPTHSSFPVDHTSSCHERWMDRNVTDMRYCSFISID
jgi:hypothetical protein